MLFDRGGNFRGCGSSCALELRSSIFSGCLSRPRRTGVGGASRVRVMVCIFVAGSPSTRSGLPDHQAEALELPSYSSSVFVIIRIFGL